MMQYTRRQRPQLREDTDGATSGRSTSFQCEKVYARYSFNMCHKVYLPKPSSYFLLYTRIAENLIFSFQIVISFTVCD